MALTQGVLNSYWRRYNQRRALTGMPSSYQEQRGMSDSLLDYQLKQNELEYNRNIQNRQLNIQDQARKDAARAANISGGMNLVGMGVQGYLGYKTLTKPPSATETATTNYLNSLTAKNTGTGVGSGGGTLQPGVGSGTTTPTYDPTATAAYDASLAEGASQGVGSTAGTGSGVGMGGASSYGAGAGMGVGLLAGAATNYALQTGEGEASNARVADASKAIGMTSWNDKEYGSKGSATVGGVAGGGAFGAAAANVVWDVSQAVKTGKVSNELLGIPFADKLFNTNLSSIFGW